MSDETTCPLSGGNIRSLMIAYKTRMHSSKMHTTHLLTISHSAWGWVSAQGRGVCLGCVCPGGVCLGVSAWGVSTWGVSTWGCLPMGVFAHGGVCPVVCVSQHSFGQTSPFLDKILDTHLWIHYLPTTTVAGSNKNDRISSGNQYNWRNYIFVFKVCLNTSHHNSSFHPTLFFSQSDIVFPKLFLK